MMKVIGDKTLEAVSEGGRGVKVIPGAPIPNHVYEYVSNTTIDMSSVLNDGLVG